MIQKRTFAILKPANIVAQGMIFERLKVAGFQVTFETTRVFGLELLERHYAHVVDRPFFSPMAEYLMSGISVLLILERSDDLDPVQSLRDLVGPTDPKKGKPGQIRHDFGVHDPDVIFMNAIHASGNPEEAEAEIKLFFPDKVPSSSWKISPTRIGTYQLFTPLARVGVILWLLDLFFLPFSL